MKRVLILKIAFISMIIFTIAGGYFWYIYFNENDGKIVSSNARLELLNNGAINYINAMPNDSDNVIPTYYFRVKNNLNMKASYELVLDEISPSAAGDGCTSATFFQKNELMYELKLDNKLIKSGRLSTLKDNLLDSNVVSGNSTNDYSLRIFIANDTDNSLQKHYHYVVNLKESNESVS